MFYDVSSIYHYFVSINQDQTLRFDISIQTWGEPINVHQLINKQLLLCFRSNPLHSREESFILLDLSTTELVTYGIMSWSSNSDSKPRRETCVREIQWWRQCLTRRMCRLPTMIQAHTGFTSSDKKCPKLTLLSVRNSWFTRLLWSYVTGSRLLVIKSTQFYS